MKFTINKIIHDVVTSNGAKVIDVQQSNTYNAMSINVTLDDCNVTQRRKIVKTLSGLIHIYNHYSYYNEELKKWLQIIEYRDIDGYLSNFALCHNVIEYFNLMNIYEIGHKCSLAEMINIMGSQEYLSGLYKHFYSPRRHSDLSGT